MVKIEALQPLAILVQYHFTLEPLYVWLLLNLYVPRIRTGFPKRDFDNTGWRSENKTIIIIGNISKPLH